MTKKQSLFHIAKRDTLPWYKSFAIRGCAIILALVVCAVVTMLMTAYAVRGLDINTSYTIYNLLTEQKMKGVAVVYVGEDLDVLLELCDRIVVLCGGQVSGVVDGRKTNKLEVGALMTHVEGGKADE